jgi:TPR repeat protein
MHLVGMCAENGLAGAADPKKAEAAYQKAADMGFPKSRCALGQMLMRQKTDAERGLLLCKESAQAGDVDAQMSVADAYFSGGVVPKDRKEARTWYEKAAAQKNPAANRRLGEMYANGDGGKKDMKKAIDYWKKAEAAGDPMSSILVADALFSELTGGKKPGPGQYAFKGGIPLQDVETTEAWYQDAAKRDPRPDVKPRAEEAIRVLEGFKQAGQVKTDKTKKK